MVEQGGPFSRERPGLLNGEALWRLLGRAAVMSGVGERVIVVTAALPTPRSESDLALRAVGPRVLFDVIDIHDAAARDASMRMATVRTPRWKGFGPPTDRKLLTQQRVTSTSSVNPLSC